MDNDLKTFIERWQTIDKMLLFDKYKEMLKPAVIREAIRQAKLRTRLGDEVVILDDLVAALDGKIH